jgi:ABC-type phosphate/phosphonate transport system substrate-binding protein/outer membrane protein assembly factor BamB
MTKTSLKKALGCVLLTPFILAAVWLWGLYRGIDVEIGVHSPEPLRILVTDPLCAELAPEPLKDRATRDYGPLGTYLQERLGRPVEIRYSANPQEIPRSDPRQIDLMIGRIPQTSGESAALDVASQEPDRLIAHLTNLDGGAEVSGLFVVRRNSPAKTLGDLADHRIQFGPPCEAERHSAALALLAEHGVAPIPPLKIVPDCAEALAAVAQGDADAAVIPSYARPLLEGFAGVEKRTLRVLAQTAPQPFVVVFAGGSLRPVTERALRDALLAVRAHPQLLAALASSDGFVDPDDPPAEGECSSSRSSVIPWTDWRGPRRDAVSPDVPDELPAGPRILWKHGLTGPGLAGVAATATHVLVADKSGQNDQDIWRCLDAETGRELWAIAYPTPSKMEFTNAARATPVIHGGLVYLLGAFGDLHCVSIEGRQILWRRNIVQEFGAKLPTWGMCSTPLVVDDKLIVNPGAPNASLAALSLYTGETLWQTPGEPPGYGSLILGTFGGVRQIVGHDATSLAGWDPNTGRRLWTLLPAKKGDFNVPTPLNLDGRLLIATENNGARLYDFDEQGRINPIPIIQNRTFDPDTSTPVAIDGLLFGFFRGLHCLDAGTLVTLYHTDADGLLRDYATLIAGNGHILAITVKGELLLIKAAREAYTPVSRLTLFKDTEVWSHPALLGNRLYLRSMKEICCFLLK